jgi:hypothetical protein
MDVARKTVTWHQTLHTVFLRLALSPRSLKNTERMFFCHYVRAAIFGIPILVSTYLCFSSDGLRTKSVEDLNCARDDTLVKSTAISFMHPPPKRSFMIFLKNLEVKLVPYPSVKSESSEH